MMVESLPGLSALHAVEIAPRRTAATDAVCVLVQSDGDVPEELGIDWGMLRRMGFEGRIGQTVLIPRPSGSMMVATGAGEQEALDAASLRDAAAAASRATRLLANIAIVAPPLRIAAGESARAIVEGAVLSRYRYSPLKTKHDPSATLEQLAVELEGTDGGSLMAEAADALIGVRAAIIARDLTNTPPGRLTAEDLGGVAQSLGREYGFSVELFDRAALSDLGCGGILGVNSGSVDEPRMIKLEYLPSGIPTGHVGLVGKGIMYDSGGISLKPSDPMHLLMKMDMGGAAAVLGAFTGFRDRQVRARVTGWLMCTDNMPSGSACKLGDVLVARNGTTVEVKNTDAEGRLVLMDALALAVEAEVDAVIDIATLTGGALMALGTATAALFANDDSVAALLLRSSTEVDEPLWRLPLESKYRSHLDSDVADMANVGGKYASATTAALFLEHFVGKTPWAHLDIAGTMSTENDDVWRSAGATGFGARTLLRTMQSFCG
ncbi:leucyl aminopeptidase family protein [Microbacterium natoriense]